MDYRQIRNAEDLLHFLESIEIKQWACRLQSNALSFYYCGETSDYDCIFFINDDFVSVEELEKMTQVCKEFKLLFL